MMAQEVDDGQFWLPSEILTDDELLMDFRAQSHGGFRNEFGFNSNFSSPVESVNGSVETESDEDDFISGLTWNMAKTSLNYPAKGLKMYGSPQSTLCGCESGTDWACSNCRFVPTPSPTEVKPAINWNLLYAAAEEVARLRMANAKAPFRSAAPKPTSETFPFGVQSPFYPYKSRTEAQLAFLQLRATQVSPPTFSITSSHSPLQFQRMKQQQLLKSCIWGQNQTDSRNRILPGETWPTLQQSVQQRRSQQQQPVFPGDSTLKKERNGTGVFLPRRFGFNPNEPRKKPTAPVHPDGGMVHRNNTRVAMASATEVRLPQDWTY